MGTVFAYDTGAPACSAGSWPRFHHDVANSGDYARDAVLPGRPTALTAHDGELTFTAPGDDLLCGTVKGYEVRVGDGSWKKADAGDLAAPGAQQTLALPDGAHGRVRVRAVDDQGNAGRAAAVVV